LLAKDPAMAEESWDRWVRPVVGRECGRDRKQGRLAVAALDPAMAREKQVF
jgi:hypothetical protein